MTTFGLIPGAFHAASCWRLVVEELAARGHVGVPVDLPCDDPSAGFARYVGVTRDTLASAGDDLVLVGHSLGAHTAASGRRRADAGDRVPLRRHPTSRG